MAATPELVQEAAPAIPESPIFNVLNGKPLYYEGYREAIAKHLNPESVVGLPGKS